jgi:hypothetical protein
MYFSRVERFVHLCRLRQSRVRVVLLPNFLRYTRLWFCAVPVLNRFTFVQNCFWLVFSRGRFQRRKRRLSVGWQTNLFCTAIHEPRDRVTLLPMILRSTGTQHVHFCSELLQITRFAWPIFKHKETSISWILEYPRVYGNSRNQGSSHIVARDFAQ